MAPSDGHMSAGRVKRFHKHWILTIGILSLLGMVLAYDLYLEHRRTESVEDDRLQVQARVIDENLSHQLVATYRSLQRILGDLPQWRAGASYKPAANLMLKTLEEAIPGVRTFIIIDAQGIARASNRQILIGRPSLESLHNAITGRYRHVRLQHRISTTPAPRMTLLDVRNLPLNHGLSEPLLQATARHLDAGGQVFAVHQPSWLRTGVAVSSVRLDRTLHGLQRAADAAPPSRSPAVPPLRSHRAGNNNNKFLLYRNCLSVQIGTDDYKYAKAQGWLLKGIDGNYVTESNYNTLYPVDITNSSYQLWLGNLFVQWLAQHPSFDGILADNALKCSSLVFNSICSATPINPQTGTYYTDQQILDGMFWASKYNNRQNRYKVYPDAKRHLEWSNMV